MEDPGNHHITFDQTPQTRFYMCSTTCRNHVLSSENLLYKDLGLKAIICKNPVNMEVNARLVLYHDQEPVVEVNCNECDRILGHKFVMVGARYRIAQEERFMFYMNRMLYWNGSQVVYADTNQPVENTDSQEKEISTEEFKSKLS